MNLWLPSPWSAPSFGRTDHSPHRTVRNRFRVTRLSSGHDSPLQDHGSHTPFPGYRTPPVALRPVAGFPDLRLLRPLCDPRARTPAAIPQFDTTTRCNVGETVHPC